MTNPKQCRNRNNHFEQHLTAQEIERQIKRKPAYDKGLKQEMPNRG